MPNPMFPENRNPDCLVADFTCSLCLSFLDVYHGHGILRIILPDIANFCIFLTVSCLDEWKILMLSFVHKSLECLNYELPKFRYDLWCACLLLISTLFCSPFKISDWSADIDHSCILLLESLKLFWSLSLSALWVAYPFRQYNFPMLDCLQLSSQAAYPCRLSLHNAALFYLLSFILFSITGLQNLCKGFPALSWQIQRETTQLLFHPGF